MKGEIRQCLVCGKDFLTYNKRQIICDDPVCKKTRHNMTQRRNKMLNIEKHRERNRLWMQEHRHKKHEPKEDTIIAEGYAERQIAKTLASVGRINTNL